MKDVPNSDIALRSAAISQSNGSGPLKCTKWQGFVRCYCKRKCKTNIRMSLFEKKVKVYFEMP